MKLNLDNIRLFLYGSNKKSSPKAAGEEVKAALGKWTGSGRAARYDTRSKFMEHHLGSEFTALLRDKYFAGKDYKWKSNFLTELFTKKSNKRGTMSLVDELAEKYYAMELGFDVSYISKLNFDILSHWNLDGFDKKLTDFIGLMIADEAHGTDRESIRVTHILQIIRDTSLRMFAASDSLESRADILAMLIAAALMRDKCPEAVLEIGRIRLDKRQRYDAANVLCMVATNMVVLKSEIEALESFLNELSLIEPIIIGGGDKASQTINDFSEFYRLQIHHIDKAMYMVDHSDIVSTIDDAKLPLDNNSTEFLHSAYTDMDLFTKSVMEQILQYIQNYVQYNTLHNIDISLIITNCRSNISDYRSLVYWNVVALTNGIERDITRDIETVALEFVPYKPDGFDVHRLSSREDIQSKIISLQRAFRKEINCISDANFTVIIPES